MSWKEDLALGEFWETEAIKKLAPDTHLKMEGQFCYFDYVTVKDKIITLIEVKSDRIAKTTGNIAIEFLHNKRKSGIDVTKAHFWIYVVIDTNPEFYKIPVDVLKEKVYRQEYSDIKGVDGDRTWVYLFDKNLFAEYRLT